MGFVSYFGEGAVKRTIALCYSTEGFDGCLYLEIMLSIVNRVYIKVKLTRGELQQDCIVSIQQTQNYVSQKSFAFIILGQCEPDIFCENWKRVVKQQLYSFYSHEVKAGHQARGSLSVLSLTCWSPFRCGAASGPAATPVPAASPQLFDSWAKCMFFSVWKDATFSWRTSPPSNLSAQRPLKTHASSGLCTWISLILPIPFQSLVSPLYVHLSFLTACPADFRLQHRPQNKQLPLEYLTNFLNCISSKPCNQLDTHVLVVCFTD